MLTDLFGSVAGSIVSLIISRDGGPSDAEIVHKTVMSVIEGGQPGQLWMPVPEHDAEETTPWPPAG